jgi:hypothetical protein
MDERERKVKLQPIEIPQKHFILPAIKASYVPPTSSMSMVPKNQSKGITLERTPEKTFKKDIPQPNNLYCRMYPCGGSYTFNTLPESLPTNEDQFLQSLLVYDKTPPLGKAPFLKKDFIPRVTHFLRRKCDGHTFKTSCVIV